MMGTFENCVGASIPSAHGLKYTTVAHLFVTFHPLYAWVLPHVPEDSIVKAHDFNVSPRVTFVNVVFNGRVAFHEAIL